MADKIYECVCGETYGIVTDHTLGNSDHKEIGVYHELCYLDFIWGCAPYITNEIIEKLVRTKDEVDKALETRVTLDKLL